MERFQLPLPPCGRREFLIRSLGSAAAWSGAAGAATAWTGASSTAAAPARPPDLAAIVVGYGIRMHGDNIVTRLLEGHWINGTFHPPRCRIAALHTRRVGPVDMGRRLGAAYGFKLWPTVGEALTLGTGRLKVDGVVIVSEAPGVLARFDDNPFREFFEEIVRVFRASGRSVPVFNDKQLSSRWPESKWMVEQSRELGFPMLAGSSISVTYRRPELDFPPETPLEEAVVVGAVPIEHLQSITFHCLELLQSLVERRPGGETGVRAVELLEGEAVWQAAAVGRWSRELFDAAVARSTTRQPGRPQDRITRPVALLVEYRDGFRAAVVGGAGLVGEFTAAVRVRGRSEIASTLAYYPGDSGNAFSCLVTQVERFMVTRRPAIPIERTLLTSGIIDFMMVSRTNGHKRYETPELGISYKMPAERTFCDGPGS